jgi:hypothetical protein
MANAAPMRFVRNCHTRRTIALCGDGGFTMLGMGDLLTQVQRRTRVVQIIFNKELLDFVNIEQQEASIIPFGTGFKNPNFAKVADAMGAKGIPLKVRATFASFPSLLKRRRLGGAGWRFLLLRSSNDLNASLPRSFDARFTRPIPCLE